VGDKRQEPHPEQVTHKGLSIPIPKRKDVLDALERAADPEKSGRPDCCPKLRMVDGAAEITLQR
jgi:hypothetical protein